MFEQIYFGNSVSAYLTSLAILLGGMAAIYIFKHYILSRLRKLAESSATTLDDLVVRQSNAHWCRSYILACYTPPCIP